MAGEKKKEAKMGHNKGTTDSGRKPSIPCSCGAKMVWSKVNGKMRWVCPSCGLIQSA